METIFVMYETNFGSWTYPLLPNGWKYVATDMYVPKPDHQYAIVFSHEAHFTGPKQHSQIAIEFLEQYFHSLKDLRAVKEYKIRKHYLPYTH